MRYADYNFYINDYGGSLITEAAFPNVILRASAYLDRVTLGRIEDESNEVKYAACEMAEQQYQSDQKGTAAEIKSENNDGYSVTFVTEGKDGQTAAEVLERKMFQTAKKWLGNTGLLYLGVNP